MYVLSKGNKYIRLVGDELKKVRKKGWVWKEVHDIKAMDELPS